MLKKIIEIGILHLFPINSGAIIGLCELYEFKSIFKFHTLWQNCSVLINLKLIYIYKVIIVKLL
jgi:hypothetical protein